ncbi:aromatic amino acid hydroxylase [Laceyella tengchongensis]|uniref:Phenylalanine 4-hydroxylase n=1 Tax=Laceyella tengchongensis TaxID=574699 RepID=A0AA45WM72_9BACL|nr:aromatic amino acid hydroxylase [Laceyella tengchongensis]MRG28633.1 aromatic amino acid hydroxylase [Laceyella tengchongensis]SMP13190.1 Phenylalanine 4-hydroxylase [Laceyella tengchongensis]
MNIPAHLQPYVAKQQYQRYTPVNQAVWRYVMRQNRHFFQHTAHQAYVSGLQKTGIDIEQIPSVEKMNACLKPFGWGAVPINGLIPGVAFFDFQARGLLPIATEIRTLEHIQYTPAPDIIHESAGHAPILSDEKYADYVKRFGRIGAKALANREEHEVFEATRHLTIVMEDPHSTPDMIADAEQALQEKIAAATEVSEATQIGRLYWWTVEYGLIGDLKNPKIYGAGLLSSIGEGQSCLSPEVTKLPFSLEACIQTDYDVTKPQPQLFVCRDFDELSEAVERFADRMAFRVGGTASLQKAVRSAHLATAEFNSGLQVSGVFTELIYDEQGEAIYLRTAGPTALSFEGRTLPGHGKATHCDGFGAPIGHVRDLPCPLEEMTSDRWADDGWSLGTELELHYTSGIKLKGILKDAVFRNGRLILLSFEQCSVMRGDHLLFHPDWGTYDLAIGSRITSVYAGAADPETYFADEVSAAIEVEDDPAPALSTLDHLYQAVREVREGQRDIHSLNNIMEMLDHHYPEDWLLRLEILEIVSEHQIKPWVTRLRGQLDALREANPALDSLIQNGITLIDCPVLSKR